MNDKIKDIYPLGPGQAGLLFHAVAAPHSGQYVVQIVLHLSGAHDPEREEAAWQALVARHDALRTALVWEGQKQPLQVVGHRALAETGVTPGGDDTAFAHWLEEDRARGFDLRRAPLLRVRRFDQGPVQRIVVTFHHIVLDGWSIPLLLRDWIALYAGEALPPPLPFRDHIAWLHGQDRAAAIAFWRGELAGGAPLAGWALPAPDAPAAVARGEVRLDLGAELTTRLEDVASRHRITLGTITHGLWALLQARYGGGDDVVYGLARAGRPAQLPGSEGRVGMFLNTLPMRARVQAERPLSGWLADLQARQMAQTAHDHAAMAEVQAASGTPMPQSVVVFENYPTDPALLGQTPGFTITAVEVREQTNFPLALYAAKTGAGLSLRLLYDAGAVCGKAAAQLLADLRLFLNALADDPGQPVAALPRLAVDDQPKAARPAPQATGRAHSAPPLPAPDAALAAIWRDLLQVSAIAPPDSFFDLGGHSLLVIPLQQRIRAALGVTPDIADIFRHPTLEGMSAHLHSLRSPDGDTGTTRPDARADARATGADRLRQRRLQAQKHGSTEHV